MPHRTVFQWGKNHAHPFTTFVGGFVVGGLVVGSVFWAWDIAGETDIDSPSVLTGKKPAVKASAAPSPRVSPTTSPAVQF